RRERAAQAVRRGVDALLKSQVRQDGRLTVWSAQHDPVTLAPVGARRFEPASLSGQESVGLVRFLMGIDQPGPDVIAAVEGAVAWFRATALY
ncbi:pectate lyase, partial [Klebsiella pneumoniae]